MLKRCGHFMIATIVVVCTTGVMRSQDGQLTQLRIEVMAGGGGLLPKYRAGLEGLQNRKNFGSAELDPDGVWRFRDVPYGEYKLTIVEGPAGPVYEQMITVGPQTLTIMVRLPWSETPRPPSGTVSLWQLRNPIPKKALQVFSASQKFFDAGDYDSAAKELQKAIRISPSYAEAYSALAAIHIKLGLYEEAISEISRAEGISGPNARDRSNLALAEYKLERYADSAQSARSALRLDPNHNPAHYVLGVVLARDRRTMEESVPHLERAGQTIEGARATLSLVLKTLENVPGH
jgi:tetratricopeptide (TPR) repeat protein